MKTLYVSGKELDLVKTRPELAHLKANIIKEYACRNIDKQSADIKMDTTEDSARYAAYRLIKSVANLVLKEEKQAQFENLKVGDGVTLHGYSDREAYTVISRTKSKVVAQMDKATRDPNFKPEFISGGFSAHCTNQEEQTYTYERDAEGRIIEITFSKKYGRMQLKGTNSPVTLGRKKFYDYNF